MRGWFGGGGLGLDGAGFAADFFEFAVEVQGVRNDAAPAGRREIHNQAFGRQRVERWLELAEVFDRFHAGGPAAQFADGLRSAEQQLGHHGEFNLLDAEPFVGQVAIAIDAASALHLHHGAGFAELLTRFVDLLFGKLHQRRAVVFLVAARAERVR